MLKRLNEHMVENGHQNYHQFAYKQHHSCETLLLKFTNDILLTMENRNCSLVVMCDLSVAFDTVDHKKLVVILSKYFYISGTALKWLLPS